MSLLPLIDRLIDFLKNRIAIKDQGNIIFKNWNGKIKKLLNNCCVEASAADFSAASFVCLIRNPRASSFWSKANKYPPTIKQNTPKPIKCFHENKKR